MGLIRKVFLGLPPLEGKVPLFVDYAVLYQPADDDRDRLRGEPRSLGDLDPADALGRLDRAEHDVDVVAAHLGRFVPLNMVNRLPACAAVHAGHGVPRFSDAVP